MVVMIFCWRKLVLESCCFVSVLPLLVNSLLCRFVVFAKLVEDRARSFLSFPVILLRFLFKRVCS